MPHLENNFGRTGLGAMTLAGSVVKASGIFNWPIFWIIATLIGMVSSAVVVAACGSIWRVARPLEKAVLHIVTTSCVAQFVLAFARVKFFDRYALVLLPAALLVVVLYANRWRLAHSVVQTGLWMLMALSIFGVKDYLQWNSAKYQAGRSALEQGLMPWQLANGFDWSGYFTYEPNMERLKTFKPLRNIGEAEWQDLNMCRALTSFGPAWPGHTRLAAIAYSTPLATREQAVYVWSLAGNIVQ